MNPNTKANGFWLSHLGKVAGPTKTDQMVLMFKDQKTEKQL